MILDKCSYALFCRVKPWWKYFYKEAAESLQVPPEGEYNNFTKTYLVEYNTKLKAGSVKCLSQYQQTYHLGRVTVFNCVQDEESSQEINCCLIVGKMTGKDPNQIILCFMWCEMHLEKYQAGQNAPQLDWLHLPSSQ